MAKPTQFVCQGCTYVAPCRNLTCPMCGALMQRVDPDAKKPLRAGGRFAAVPFIA